uniref:Uncharacterized protein n=1 Tax=Homalodisca liturata TaxID=320908 RepID=A0A1B6J7Q2_9HEMI
MDFKTRCPLCYKFFCCVAHRSDHELKNHPVMFTKETGRIQNMLVKRFEKKAERYLLTSQKYQKNVQTIHAQEKTSANSNLSKFNRKSAPKRLYSEMNKRILSTSVSVRSETRQFLVPIRRLSTFNHSNDETGTKSFNEAKGDSPCDGEIGKTSTPINDAVEDTPQHGERRICTPGSTISVYQTPCSDFKPDGQNNFKPRANRAVVTPLRSIMSKISRYEGDSETGPSPIINNSRCRRVTFSFSSSQASSINSSPLEVVEEVETHVEIQEQKLSTPVCLVESYKGSDVLSEDFKEIKSLFEDSSSVKEGGFFNCVTSIFCSAVHTIPSIGSWGLSQNKNRNNSKRCRSPEIREAGEIELSSPIHKRPCYPCDLRLNPIKARKPIGNS